MENGIRSRMDMQTAREIFLRVINPVQGIESIPLELADNRVLASDIEADFNVPHYDRAAMDGFAVIANDTLGAAPSAPVLLHLTDGGVQPGTCQKVHTGSAIPAGADAVVMLEDARRTGDTVEIMKQVHPNKHVGRIGEDVVSGELLFRSGHLLRPGDLAVLASTGIRDVEVFHRPLVAIIPTGEEVVPRTELLKAGQVWETNSLMTAAYVRRFGGVPRISEIVPDDPDLIKKTLTANSDADLIIISGGTSVGERDHVPAALMQIGELLVHGVAISPGKPTSLGRIKQRPVLCMPGYPVAGLVALLVFGKDAITRLGHVPPQRQAELHLPLSQKITSRQGYHTFVRVKINNGSVEPLMTAGAGILSSAGHADGYVMVPPNIEGYQAGTMVDVILF